MTRVTVIYATAAAITPIQRELDGAPELEVLTLLDEALLRCALEDGGVEPRGIDRMAAQLRLAVQAGSEAVLVTCNIYSGFIPALRRELAPLTILGVDEPMVQEAIDRFRRIGVVATLQDGLTTQLELLRKAADAQERDVELVSVVCDGARRSLESGDGQRHDELIADAVRTLEAQEVDGVVLAQASMTRALGVLSPSPFPVLSSPSLAVAELRRMVGSRLSEPPQAPA